MTGPDVERAIAIAQKWVNDPRRRPYSERVILAQAFLDVAKYLADQQKDKAAA